MTIDIKFCGLSTTDSVDAAIGAGARYLGFVFFPPSPRNIAPERAAGLIARIPPGIGRVAVLVDADDETIDAVIAAGIDTLQLHGKESPARIANLKARTGKAVWRATGVKTRADISAAISAAGSADRLLLDAKAPSDSAIPGGNGVAFDWRLMQGVVPRQPWGLGGGLHAGNIGAALAAKPDFVDVSSGIEDQPGVKSLSKIVEFGKAVRGT